VPPRPFRIPDGTDRLVFVTWQEGDAVLAMGLWGDPEVTALLVAGQPWTREEVLGRLGAEIACEREHGVQYWPVFLKAGGEHVGCCGLRPRDPDRGIWELGAHLRGKFWGQGLAAEAARAVIRFAFQELGAAALFAGHHPDNAASRRLLEGLGFRCTHREFYPPTGSEHPSYLLTAKEHPERPAG
jgi:ribosomal-protein-alanine N-acetyltransferase